MVVVVLPQDAEEAKAESKSNPQELGGLLCGFTEPRFRVSGLGCRVWGLGFRV